MALLTLSFLVSLASAQPLPTDIVVEARPSRVLDAPVVADPVLATMRGGILLANGFDIAIGLDIQTRVDGQLVLHTIYASDGPMAGVRVYTDGSDAPRVAPGTVMVNIPGEQGDTAVTVDRSPTGTTISLGGTNGAATVNLVNAAATGWLSGAGQTRVPVTEGGGPVTQGPGTFSLATGEQGSVVTLDAAMLQIRHLVGQATGIVVANTANDRAIDTISSINVDLQGVSPSMMAGLFMAEQLAVEVMSRR